MKMCTGCKNYKPLVLFGKAKLGKDGLRAICKLCHNLASTLWQKNNSNHVAKYGKMRRQEKKEQISIQRAIHTAKNKERLAAYEKAWRLANPGKMNAKTAKRRAQKNQATPKWLTEIHWKEIESFYVEAAKLTQQIGTK